MSNFYHALKAQNQLPFGAERYLALTNELSRLFDITQVVFYDSVKSISLDPTGYAKQQRFHANLVKLVQNSKIMTRPLRYVVSIMEKDVEHAANAVGLPKNIHGQLYLFLKKLGLIKLSKEKGLDVLLVVGLIHAHKSRAFNQLILLSGDSDYVPAVQIVQNEGGHVINLHAYAGSSSELRKACKEHILFAVDSGKIKLKRYENTATS